MEEKTIAVGSKTFKIREMLASELDAIIEITDKKEALKKQVILSAGISEEEYSKLTVKERMVIMQTINDINGVSGFQNNSK